MKEFDQRFAQGLDNEAYLDALDYVTVDLSLKPTQERDGQWICTLNGETRIVPKGIVRYYARDLKAALEAFNPKEILKFTLTCSGKIAEEEIKLLLT